MAKAPAKRTATKKAAPAPKAKKEALEEQFAAADAAADPEAGLRRAVGLGY